jgi:hypothetical protein
MFSKTDIPPTPACATISADILQRGQNFISDLYGLGQQPRKASKDFKEFWINLRSQGSSSSNAKDVLGVKKRTLAPQKYLKLIQTLILSIQQYNKINIRCCNTVRLWSRNSLRLPSRIPIIPKTRAQHVHDHDIEISLSTFVVHPRNPMAPPQSTAKKLHISHNMLSLKVLYQEKQNTMEATGNPSMMHKMHKTSCIICSAWSQTAEAKRATVTSTRVVMTYSYTCHS